MADADRGRDSSHSASAQDKYDKKEKDRKREKRASRKLTKKRPESSNNPRSNSMAQMTASGMEIPERFRQDEDEKEDVTAMPGGLGGLGDMGIQYGNRSVFSLITTAGSNINSDFNTAFGGESSDEDDEGEETETEQTGNGRTSKDAGSDISKASAPLRVPKRRESKKDHRPPLSGEKRHYKKLSDKNFFKSSPRLNHQISSGSSKTTPAPSREDTRKSSSELQSPFGSPPSPASPRGSMSTSVILRTRDPKRNAPMMSSMLEAEAQLSTRPSFDIPRSTRQSSIAKSETENMDDILSNSLATRLMEIFHFDEAEEVLQEYPCWLLKSVLLQGYMYITQKHICFYAYLPKKTNEVVKSGYLAKRGKQNPKYNRYWFKLSGDVLSYYSDPADLYFPSGHINLSYGISAEVADKEKGKDATNFTVVTHQRKYYFKADSVPSAKEWVKSLQKIIFRSRNEGDSVKISLPVENIIDVEDAPVVDFAETCKIRVIDNDETYAIDEYFFSFFSFGKEAFEVLQNLVEDTAAQQIPPGLLNFSANQDGADSPRESASKRSSMHLSRERQVQSPIRTRTPVLEDSVRATLSPMLSPTSHRVSAEYGRSSFDGLRRSSEFGRTRRSVDLNRMGQESEGGTSAGGRSVSLNRLAEGEPSEQQGSSASYVQSMEDPGSSAAVASDETQASASQILRGSDVFTSPTIQRSASKSRKSKGQDHFISRSPERLTVDPPHPKHAATTGSLAGSNAGQVEPSNTPTLTSIMKAGSYPLQRAAGLAGYLTKNSKRMSSLLASESMGYVEKVSGMWKGGKRHYDAPQGGPIADGESDDEFEGDAEQVANANHRFHIHFALPEKEKLHAAYFGYLHRVLPLYGKIYISDRSFCFRSLLPGTRTKLILPLKDIYTVDKEKGFRFGYSGLVIAIKGHEEIFFEFGHSDTRDDCVVTLLLHLEEVKYLKESGLLSLEEKERAEAAVAENKALQEARQRGQAAVKLPSSTDDIRNNSPPILFDDPRASILNFKPTQSLRITCLTIGSRGDVQPYIALCKGLLAEGHKPKIATHMEFKSFVEDNGIAFEPVEGDPAELMRICVDNGMFTVSFLREAQSKFRGWIDMLLTSAWKACQNTDILIESPSAMAGIHIAEALEIPYFRAFTMPWTRTRAYPHAFAVPNAKRGGAYNIMSYVMFDNVFWTFTSGQINRWRKKELGLPSTSLVKLEPNKVPFLYNFSPHVVVPPIDYSDWIRITGYWFFDESKSIPSWKPPPEIVAFIKKARSDGKKIVYIGFGSITVPDAADLLKTCCESVLKADVRCILSKGWSDRLDSAHREKHAPLLAAKNLPPDTPVTLHGEIVIVPEDVLIIKSCAHDWLFSQIDAAAHHGGAGTTGASLRAGLPTIIKPFFGDQFFFGRRVEELGVGICLKVINKSVLSRALFFACNEERMIVKANVLGEAIRKEDGVNTAIQSIYRDLEYAKSLIKRRNGKPLDSHGDAEGGGAGDEESWTFIGDESGDPELLNRIKEWEGFSGGGEGRAPRKSWGGERESFDFGGGFGGGGGTSERNERKALGKRVVR